MCKDMRSQLHTSDFGKLEFDERKESQKKELTPETIQALIEDTDLVPMQK